jgi:hypothetical protein
MTSHQVEKFGHLKICVHCNQIEDKLHAFAQYNHFSVFCYGSKILYIFCNLHLTFNI